MSSRSRWSVAAMLLFTAAPSLAGCEAMSGLPGLNGMTFNNKTVHVTNTMSVPICKLVLTSTVDPKATYDNNDMRGALVTPGGEKDVFYVEPKSDGDSPSSTLYKMTVIGCSRMGSHLEPGEKIVELDVDVAKRTVAIR